MAKIQIHIYRDTYTHVYNTHKYITSTYTTDRQKMTFIRK